MFKIRTEPVAVGTEPYRWNIESQYQCTWYCYYRALECGLTAPTYWDRATKQGSYPNAKEWLENYRNPWVVKDKDYTPVAGDIAVFDGEYGHVQFMETDVMYSEYSNGDPNSFRNGKFEKKDNLLGFLHYPCEVVPTVERNTSVNQIETTDTTLRIREKPSLEGEIIGHVQLGYYNVLDTKENDGYTWYKLANDRWCADITTTYLPAEDDIIERLEEYLNNIKSQVTYLKNENTDLKEDMKSIKKITERWE